jgi:integrase
MRIGEVLALRWSDVHLDPVGAARRGFIHVRKGKSRNAKRNISLTATARALLVQQRERWPKADYVFPAPDGVAPLSRSTVDHQHARVRAALSMPRDFVVHGYRHTALTRLGEASVDAFTIMRVAGHGSIAVSQRYVHPTPETLERAFDRLEASAADAAQRKRAKEQKTAEVSTISTTSESLHEAVLQ